MFCPFKYKYNIIRPDPSGSIPNQIKDCLDQVKSFVRMRLNGQKLIRINWFFNPEEIPDCEMLRGYIEESGFLGEIRLDPTLIAQAPTDGSHLQLILTSIDKVPVGGIAYKEISVIVIFLVNIGQNLGQVFGLAAVVAVQQPVRFSTAAPEVHGHGIQFSLVQHRGHGLHIP